MTNKIGNENVKNTTNTDEGPGNSHVGKKGIILVLAYLTMFFILVLYSLVILWPPKAEIPTDSQVTFLLWTNIPIPPEIRAILIVALSGALGSFVYAFNSFRWFVGNRGLKWSWTATYVLSPFVGASLGIVFYLVIRGGFFSPTSDVKNISLFGFAAVAALVGLFSDQAINKLRKVADSVLAPKEEARDPIKPPEGNKPPEEKPPEENKPLEA